MLTFNFSEFPILTTNRLILRKVTLEDAEAVYNLRNNITQFSAREPFKNIEQAREMVQKMDSAFLSSEGINWAITLKNSPQMIGGIGFWRLTREHYRGEIGYSLLPEFWNQGIMSEAIMPVIKAGFEIINLHSIEANLSPHNKPSEKILIKAGFIQEGYLHQNYFLNNTFEDTLVYGLVKPQKA